MSLAFTMRCFTIAVLLNIGWAKWSLPTDCRNESWYLEGGSLVPMSWHLHYTTDVTEFTRFYEAFVAEFHELFPPPDQGNQCPFGPNDSGAGHKFVCFINNTLLSKEFVLEASRSLDSNHSPWTVEQDAFFVPLEHIEVTSAWAKKNRGNLDLFLHANTGCMNDDHGKRGQWVTSAGRSAPAIRTLYFPCNQAGTGCSEMCQSELSCGCGCVMPLTSPAHQDSCGGCVPEELPPTPAEVPHGVLLRNAADNGVFMPAVGLGTGCQVGGCDPSQPQPLASLNMSAQWLQLGGRRIDSADSYGIEPGIGQAMQQSGIPRRQIFITSKIGPGGLCFPIGYNETLQQAEEILSNLSTPYVDLLLAHWPVNWDPWAPKASGCPSGTGAPEVRSIPTTDPLCDAALPSFSERGCMLSTWRALLEVWNRGLARAVGVSNFNTSHLEWIADAGLPMPAVNQIGFSPVHGPFTQGCTWYSSTQETCKSVLEYSRRHNIVFNGYSPFGSPGQASAVLSTPEIQTIARAHNRTTAQVILNWQWYWHGIPVNPEAKSDTHQRANLASLDFSLSKIEASAIDDLSARFETNNPGYFSV